MSLGTLCLLLEYRFVCSGDGVLGSRSESGGAKLGGNALFAYAGARSSRAQVFEANVLRTNRL